MTDTIPDALAADLRELYLTDQPTTDPLPEDALLLKLEVSELPSPRLLFIPGSPVRIPGQDATARVPFSLDFISSMDRQSPDDHRAEAGKIDDWLRAIRLSHRRNLIGSRVWLHDLYCLHPVTTIDTEDREQKTTIRGEAIVTLAITEPAEEDP